MRKMRAQGTHHAEEITRRRRSPRNDASDRSTNQAQTVAANKERQPHIVRHRNSRQDVIAPIPAIDPTQTPVGNWHYPIAVARQAVEQCKKATIKRIQAGKCANQCETRIDGLKDHIKRGSAGRRPGCKSKSKQPRAQIMFGAPQSLCCRYRSLETIRGLRST